MKKQQDYIQDIADVRSMMERSSKFLSLSGLAGVLAGMYALAGAYIAYFIVHFRPVDMLYERSAIGLTAVNMTQLLGTAMLVLLLAVGSAIFLSYRKSRKSREKFWNSSARQLLSSMMVPLVTGGLVMLILFDKGLLGWLAPISMVFYGLSLYTAGKFTYGEVKSLGLLQILLGLLGCFWVEFGILLWAIGFGLLHIIYGIYIHYRHER